MLFNEFTKKDNLKILKIGVAGGIGVLQGEFFFELFSRRDAKIETNDVFLVVIFEPTRLSVRRKRETRALAVAPVSERRRRQLPRRRPLLRLCRRLTARLVLNLSRGALFFTAI